MNSDHKTRSWTSRGWGMVVLLIFCLAGTAFSQTFEVPGITNQPSSRTNPAGTAAAFTVLAGGTEPLGYQWCKEGVPLADGGNISGALTPTLTLTRVFGTDAGGYSVMVTNAFGGVTSQVAMLSVVDPVITTQPSSLSTSKGQTVVFNVTVLGTTPVSFQWLKDGASVTEATKPSLILTNVQGVDAGNYQVMVSNAFGSITSAVAVLAVNLITPDDWNPRANGPIYSMVVQPDGKILVGGQFTTLGGWKRTGLGRVAGDGTVDAAFNPGASNTVYALAVQWDGKILVGGNFTSLGGQPRSCLGRLNPDGTLDASFNPDPNGIVNCLAVQADGKILVGGNFTSLGGQTRNYLGRLNPDGTVDATFDPGASGNVYALVVQPDGKALAGGAFTKLGGQSCSNLGRLQPDGSFDTAFTSGANNPVYALLVQPDGKIVVGGTFTILGGKPCNALGRLEFNGSLDTSFSPGAGGPVYSIVGQADGKIVLGGAIVVLGGKPCNYLGRVDANGVRDSSWNLAVSGSVYALAVQADGKVLVGGALTGLGGLGRSYLGRLNNSEPATQELILEGGTVTWRRGGTSPEVWRTCFEASTNGVNWFSLGEGARVFGGWQQAGENLPADTYLRARGFVTGGYNSGASWFVEMLGGPPLITLPPRPQRAGAGQTAIFRVAAAGTPPLSYQWRKDGTLLAGATAPTLTLTNIQTADAGYYDVAVSNSLGQSTSGPAQLVFLVPPTVDVWNSGASDSVTAMAVQVDGKVLVAGWFTTLSGHKRQGLGRFNADGTLDSAFSPVPDGGRHNPVWCLGVQCDGKVLVGGAFLTTGALTRGYFGRLNADGSPDKAFNPSVNKTIYCMAVQPDGKILVGGEFTVLSGQTRNRLGRFNADGSLDAAFHPDVWGPGQDSQYTYVSCLALQPDGKILVGGCFTNLAGQVRNSVGRLNADGTLDAAFNPGADNDVYSLALEPDGKILVGGRFATLGGQARSLLGRLNVDGTLDDSFNPGASPAYGYVSYLSAQADGCILVAGNFTTLGGQTRTNLGRLNSDGTLDAMFNLGANAYVRCLAVLPDGDILVGGDFTRFGGQPRNYLARLNNTDPGTQNLMRNGSTLTWLRGGSSPEVWRTSFEVSTNGTEWISVGAGTRIPGGWQLTGLIVPTNCPVRARGFVTGGENNGSDWLLETLMGPPVISPITLTTNAGATVTLAVGSVGSPPASCQWFKDGVELADGEVLSGVHTPMLTLSKVFGGDAGDYSVRINSASGSATSLVAMLTVMDPFIASQPASQAAHPAQAIAFDVTAGGTPPLSYQWRKDGVNLADATTASFTLTNVQAADYGRYDVLVRNGFGTRASAAALLLQPPTADSLSPVVNGSVSSLVLQADGKMVVCGTFTTLGGLVRTNLGRLNPDGSVDEEFNPGANGVVSCAVVQADGKIIVGGSFTTLGGRTCLRLGRLNPDGTVDTQFTAVADAPVNALAVQADGKILVGGAFTTLGGRTRYYLGRLTSRGVLDGTFNPGASATVYSLAVQADGKILVGGAFSSLGGQMRFRLGRLNPDGTYDIPFVTGAEGSVYSLAIQADGKILVGGSFTALDGYGRTNLARLNADGIVDLDFNPGADKPVYSLALQTDGKILAGGAFTTLGGELRSGIGRLHRDGTVDATFSAGVDNSVSALGLQADGKILVGGSFTTLTGQPRSALGRLSNTQAGTQTLTREGSTLIWWRGQTAPEVWRTTFEASTDGNTWTSLGEGTRIAGGWQLVGASVPAGSAIRARGYLTGATYNGSSWFVESSLGVTRPVILVDDGVFGILSNRFGFSLSGCAGQVVVVEASTNLVEWVGVTTNTLGAMPFYFSDPDGTNCPGRFYRARLQ